MAYIGSRRDKVGVFLRRFWGCAERKVAGLGGRCGILTYLFLAFGWTRTGKYTVFGSGYLGWATYM